MATVPKWVAEAQTYGWDVILDAAAFLANNRIDLSVVKPEFMPVSFYKIFGYPTGIGALLIKKSAHSRMHKKWFAGGTILLVSVMTDFYALEPPGSARYEDGTVNFHAFPAVIAGLEWITAIGDRKSHAVMLSNKLHDGLVALNVGNNSVKLHSPRGTDVVTFSVFKNGITVNAWIVEQSADQHGIHFRSGCFCNPGSNERTMGYTVEEFKSVYNDGASAEDFTLEKLREQSGGKPIGAIRASFGYANDKKDIDRILSWMHQFLTDL